MSKYYLTEDDRRVLRAIKRQFQSGRVSRLQSNTDTRNSRYGPLWEVVSVETDTCTVQRPLSDGTLDADTEISGVDFGTEPSVGDQGTLTRYKDGSLFFFSKGGETGALFIEPANYDTIQEVGSPTRTYLSKSYDSSAGSWSVQEDGIKVGKYDTPIDFSQYNDLCFHVDGKAQIRWTFNTSDRYSLWTCSGTLIVSFITEDFSLSSLDRASYEALSSVDYSYSIGIDAEYYDGIQYQPSETYQIDQWISDMPVADVDRSHVVSSTVYGMGIMVSRTFNHTFDDQDAAMKIDCSANKLTCVLGTQSKQ